MKVRYAILATLIVLGLLAAPLALAAGKAAEHANAHAARGLERAADTGDAEEGAAEAEPAAGVPASAEEARERGLRMGFSHALEQVPSWVKAKLEGLLAGLLPTPGKA